MVTFARSICAASRAAANYWKQISKPVVRCWYESLGLKGSRAQFPWQQVTIMYCVPATSAAAGMHQPKQLFYSNVPGLALTSIHLIHQVAQSWLHKDSTSDYSMQYLHTRDIYYAQPQTFSVTLAGLLWNQGLKTWQVYSNCSMYATARWDWAWQMFSLLLRQQ